MKTKQEFVKTGPDYTGQIRVAAWKNGNTLRVKLDQSFTLFEVVNDDLKKLIDPKPKK